MKHRYSLILITGIIIPLITIVGFVYGTTQVPPHQAQTQQIGNEPIVPSNPTNVVIRETATYDAPIGNDRPIGHFTGVIYWEELAGAGLSFFYNTSLVISASFKYYDSKKDIPFNEQCGQQSAVGIVQNCVADLGDRYVIVPSEKSFQYEITSYYKPDIIQDTGFIVIFNSQSVDFSIQIDGQPAYARTDYYNKITLPKGAGIVSEAPIDEGFLGLSQTSDQRWVLEWQYINRQMDSKHDPLMIAVTYNYDPIFLAFTEQVYQNQQEQQQQQDQINKLNLIKQSFAIIATLAIVLSLFSIFFAYLLARRKFESDLQKAKELPRREAADIEDSESLNIPVRSMFLAAMIILPMFLIPFPVAHAQTTTPESQRIVWKGTYDLRADFTLTENVSMKLPIEQNVIYVYANTSRSQLKVYDKLGNEISYKVEDNRFVVPDPGFEFSYTLDRPYTVYNQSNMLVWLDRFWLEFVNPNSQDPQDPYFHVDMTYQIILPKGAILYSASPSDQNMQILHDSNQRYHITFSDTDRRMDAFHDVFETQVTYSFIGIYDALKNLNSNFVQVKAQKQSLQSLVKVAAQEVLIFAILGIIAPLISFFIAYWVFRRRYKKMIDRAEKEQEEQIFVEAPQIAALTVATGSNASDRLTDAYIGHYYRAIEFLSEKLGIDVTIIDQSQILDYVRKSGLKIDVQLMMEIMNMGQNVRPEDSIGYDQLNEISKLVDEMIASTREEEY